MKSPSIFMYVSLFLLILIAVGIIVYSIVIVDLHDTIKRSEDHPPIRSKITRAMVSFSRNVYTYVWMPIVGASGIGLYIVKKKLRKKPEQTK